MKRQWLLGIDEAGRGPLAGPVAVGVVKVPVDFDWNLIPGVGDSKQVTPKKRGAIFRQAQALQDEFVLSYVVVNIDAETIDSIGISQVIHRAIKTALQELSVDMQTSHLLLDGSLKAPKEYSQETIIRGDASEKVIGLASIMAKETRDIFMIEQSHLYPQYQFEQHKGYGTKLHRELIALHGFSPLHRRSFCKNIKLL